MANVEALDTLALLSVQWAQRVQSATLFIPSAFRLKERAYMDWVLLLNWIVRRRIVKIMYSNSNSENAENTGTEPEA